MKLIANKPVRYKGKRHETDAEFEADDKWGDLLQRTGQARLPDSAQPRKRGRPKGSTNKQVATHDANVTAVDLVTKSADETDSDQDEQ